MQFFKANDVTLHYQLIGAPEGKPLLIFANSLGTDFRIWRDVIVQLAGEFAIVCYDKRGHGLSDLGTVPYTMDDHVEDLAALLDHLKVSNAIICGLSVGGLIAQGLWNSRPDLVRALILCDTAHKIGNEEMWNSRIAAVEKGGIAALADGIMERWFTPAFRDPANEEFAGYTNMLIRQPDEGYAATCAAIRDTDLTEVAPQIDVPCLCMVGDQDGATPPELVRELSQLVPSAAFEIVADAGHLPCIEQPDTVVALIRKFCTSLSLNGRGNG